MRNASPIRRMLVMTALLVCSLGTASRGAMQDLLVVSGNSSQVLRFDGATGAYLGVFATAPAGGYLSGATYGPDGNLYVTNLDKQTVEEFNGTTGAFIKDFITPQGGLPLFPHSITFDTAGNAYVPSHTDLILQYNSSGTFLKTFASDTVLSGPTGLLFNGGYLYASSSGNNEIIRYDLAGTPTVFASGSGLNGPAGLAFDAKGDLFVANQLGNNVLEFSPTGALLNTLSSPLLATPIDVVVGPDGNLYITSQDNNSVVEYNFATGTFSTFATSAGNPLSQPQFLVFMPLSTAVPEPTAYVLLGVGVVGALAFGRFRRGRAAA